MDPTAYFAALRGTLSADPNVRMHAELEIKRMSKLPGYAPLALHVAVTEQDAGLKLAAAINFKSKVSNCWHSRAHDPISDADKEVLRNQIVAAVVQSGLKERF
ncbi:hypothetical protein BC828DRAFT_404412, partial [Blastocladiella britannica]